MTRAGVDTVHAVDGDSTFNHGVYVQVLGQLLEELSPTVLLAPHSVAGMDYAPALANRLDLPIATDVIAIDVADGDLVVTREMYGSKVETRVGVMTPAILTLRPASWAPVESSGEATVREVEVDVQTDGLGTTVTGYEAVGAGDVDITGSDFIVAIGRGIEEEENLSLIEDLVEVTGATLASSRPIVDSGWLPKDRQVGQSGKTVTPTVYVAIGISGAVQHVAGMKASDTIVAINTDPNAPIFEVVPDLIERCQ